MCTGISIGPGFNAKYALWPSRLLLAVVVAAPGFGQSPTRPSRGPACDIAFCAPAFLSVGDNPSGVASGDLNGDGRIDLVTANTLGGTVSILFNLGRGRFAPQFEFAVGGFPVSGAVADFDQEGSPDLAVTRQKTDSVAVFVNDGLGNFSGPVSFGVGNGPNGIVTGDIDGDGDIDVLTADPFGNTISVLLNDGSAAFLLAGVFPTTLMPVQLVLTDLDGDGDEDVAAIGNSFPITLSVLLNEGGGKLGQASIMYVPGGYGHDIGAGDLDGDGDADIVIVSGLTDEVIVFENLGDGSLALAAVVRVGSFPVAVTIDDLNGDGTNELSVALFLGNEISVQRVDRSWSFTEMHRLTTIPSPRRILVADLDRNGVKDLVTASAFTDELVLLFGTCK